MALLMHLSDLHFGAHDTQVCAAVLRLARRLKVDVLVVSGDLTQRATAMQFEQAREFLDALPAAHRLVIPGNHDLPLFAWWERLSGRAHARYARCFGQELQPVCRAAGFHVIGVDTTRWWRHQRGSLSAAQIGQAAERLAGAQAQDWRIIVSHHPLAAARAQDRQHLPRRAQQATARWAAAGAQLLLSGHGHDPALALALPGLWSAHAGTAVSLRLRAQAPNSLFTLSQTVYSPGVPALRVLTRWDHDRQTGDFQPVQNHTLAPD